MNVLITGASRGIGLATAIQFLQKGHVVYGLDVEDSGITATDDIAANYHHIRCDVTKLDDIVHIPNIQILINNAGVQNTTKDIEVNLQGTMNVTELYLPYKSLQSIVMVASTSAHTGAEFPEYAASKGGILAYTKNVAKRCAEFGCTCNSISPGGVITELNRPVLHDDNKWMQIMELTPLKKWAFPEEIAEWIYFMSVVNKSMTGQDIIVDNGEMNNQTFVW